MQILVTNFGSTSLKYRLFHMTEAQDEELAHGAYERVTDYAEAVDSMIAALPLSSVDELDAVGFKTVQGGDVTGCLPADEVVLNALEKFMELAPAHNRPYADGIRFFADRYPGVKRAALFETAYYQWVPLAAREYAVPAAWRDAGIRRYGFHGASHKYVNERISALMGRSDVQQRIERLYSDGPTAFSGEPFRVISCHLGGSASITATLNGVPVGTSMGLSPQSGLPQSNRVGDLDSAAIPYAMRQLGLSLEEVEAQLTKQSGLLGLSNGAGLDMRDLRAAATAGNTDAQLALDAFVHSIRFYIGAYYAELGGLDALVFTAGIGEHDDELRADVCASLAHLGVTIDRTRNAQPENNERAISPDGSAAQVWVIPTDEERIVARETYRLFSNS